MVAVVGYFMLLLCWEKLIWLGQQAQHSLLHRFPSNSNNIHWAFELWQAVQRTHENRHFLQEVSNLMKIGCKFFSSELCFSSWSILFQIVLWEKNILNTISSNTVGELSISPEYVVLKIFPLRFYLIYITQTSVFNNSSHWMRTRIREKSIIPLAAHNAFAFLSGWQICLKVNPLRIF